MHANCKYHMIWHDLTTFKLALLWHSTVDDCWSTNWCIFRTTWFLQINLCTFMQWLGFMMRWYREMDNIYTGHTINLNLRLTTAGFYVYSALSATIEEIEKFHGYKAWGRYCRIMSKVSTWSLFYNVKTYPTYAYALHVPGQSFKRLETNNIMTYIFINYIAYYNLGCPLPVYF